MTPFGVTVIDPQDDPDMITCPRCGEDAWPGIPCLACANGEVREPVAA